MDMRMPLLVPAPRMDDAEAARQKAGAPAGFQDNIRCKPAHFCQQPAVVVYQGPELAGDRESNVLPIHIRYQAQQILYPDFSCLHATVRTGTAFTAETDFFV